MKKYDQNEIAFYEEVFWNEGPGCKGSVSNPVYFYEIEDMLNAGFTIEEIKQLYKTT